MLIHVFNMLSSVASILLLATFILCQAEQRRLQHRFGILVLALGHVRGNQGAARPPKIYRQPDKIVYFTPGDDVQLQCLAEGIPAPTYRWTRNGQEFSVGGEHRSGVQAPDSGTIILSDAARGDEAVYQCFAENSHGVSVSVNVHLAAARLELSPWDAPVQDHQVRAGNPLTLRCLLPLSRPWSDIHWVLKGPDGVWDPLPLDNRVSVDLEGRLHFANVLPSDYRSGHAYTCLVFNPAMRALETITEHFVYITGTGTEERPVYNLFSSQSYNMALKGGNLELNCIFSGSPTPSVTWSKVDGTLPANRSRVMSHGLRLLITDLRDSDAGEYDCLGQNVAPGLAEYRRMSVRVDAAPSWEEEPRDVKATVGATATFTCRAAARPAAVHYWYINGQLLDANTASPDPRASRFQRPNDNTLILPDVTVDDRMNIQCNATNKHGYIFADVSLNILERPHVRYWPVQ